MLLSIALNGQEDGFKIRKLQTNSFSIFAPIFWKVII
jgi:hypothetical protein